LLKGTVKLLCAGSQCLLGGRIGDRCCGNDENTQDGYQTDMAGKAANLRGVGVAL
jgi:hypothetical protein